jgi:glycosyltransferase involved in cell wall biosynthesis
MHTFPLDREGTCLRVALVSTPFVPVPPPRYGGTELVVAELAAALRRRSIEVVVYATGDSRPDGVEVRSYFPSAQWPPNADVDATHAAWSLRDIGRDPRGFDVVHLHSSSAVELSRLCPYPAVATVHHDCNEKLSRIYRANPHVRLVAISGSQARREEAPVSAVIHHGLSPERFPLLPEQGYLLYLGRYSREKAPHLAIEVAALARLPLVMAGEPHELDYYGEQVLPLIRRHGVLELGAVGGARKTNLLARARALIFPVQWAEPFGLVMIEAQLCGVPVLALRRGSVPEVVQDGITGLVADDPCELVSGARVADKLFDRARIRALASERWSADRMASEYLQLYRQAVAENFVAADAGYAG